MQSQTASPGRSFTAHDASCMIHETIIHAFFSFVTGFFNFGKKVFYGFLQTVIAESAAQG
jgi:hypothetical protein